MASSLCNTSGCLLLNRWVGAWGWDWLGTRLGGAGGCHRYGIRRPEEVWREGRSRRQQCGGGGDDLRSRHPPGGTPGLSPLRLPSPGGVAEG
ncbi:hypothetical protein DIPPA_17842 [Diplonema papillatum]|nr:hypothetical protein DIPPA_17842 [Diplonema papillatum]